MQPTSRDTVNPGMRLLEVAALTSLVVGFGIFLHLDGFQTLAGNERDAREVSPGVIVEPLELAVTEGVSMPSYSVTLSRAPTNDLSIIIEPGPEVATNKERVVFTRDNWSVPQTVLVQAFDDTKQNPNRRASIRHKVASGDHAFAGSVAASVVVVITDND